MSTIGLVVSYSHIVEVGVGGGASTLNRDLTPVPPPFPPKKQGKWGGRGERGEERRTKQGEGRGTGGGTWGNRRNFLGEKRALTRTLNPNSPPPQTTPPPNP